MHINKNKSSYFRVKLKQIDKKNGSIKMAFSPSFSSKENSPNLHRS